MAYAYERIVILDPATDPETIHAVSPISTVLTLCGFVDVDCEDADESGPITCQWCLDVIRHCRKIKIR